MGPGIGADGGALGGETRGQFCTRAGAANTGGGGGGSPLQPLCGVAPGGRGGSGVVKVRYLNPTTVTFNANGGSGSMATQQANVAQSLTTNTFTRSGFTFAGWSTSAGGSIAYGNGATYNFVAGGTTLFAQWTAVPPPPPPPSQYTLTYAPNGGTCTASGVTDVDGTWVTLPGTSACTRTGYTFTGWNTQANGGGIGFNPGGSTQLTGDNTLYAQWRLDSTPSPTPSPTPAPTSSPNSEPSPSPAPDTSPSGTPGSGALGPIPEPTATPGAGDVDLQPQQGSIGDGGSGTVEPTQGGSASPGGSFSPGSIAIWDGTRWVQQFTDPGVGSWVVLNGRISFTPVPGFVGTASTTARVTDSNGSVGYTPVSFTVTPRPTPTPTSPGAEPSTPSASPEGERGSQGVGPIPGPPDIPSDQSGVVVPPLTAPHSTGSASLDVVSGASPSGNAEIDRSSVRVWDGVGWVEAFEDPGVGTWSVVAGRVSFSPAEGFCGSASTAYRVTDSAGKSGSAPIAFTSQCPRTGSNESGIVPGPPPPSFDGSRTPLLDSLGLEGEATADGGVIDVLKALGGFAAIPQPESLRVWNGRAWATEFRDPKVGRWLIENGRIIFTPHRGFTGVARTTFRIAMDDGLIVQGPVGFTVPIMCRLPLTRFVVVGFEPNATDTDAGALERALSRLSRGCDYTISGYVQPAGPVTNDRELSEARAMTVADALSQRLPDARVSVRVGARWIQEACEPWENRCAVIRPRASRPAPVVGEG